LTGKPSKRRYARAAGRAKPRAPKPPRSSANLLSTVFVSMGEGISVFDMDLRLVAWNERFIDMTGVDRKVVKVGAKLRDILASQIAAGEFAASDLETEITRRISDLWSEKEIVRERVRPNGRVIQLRRSPIPGGGYVTIYVDITDIKRAEAALREANADLERRVEDRAAQLRKSEERYALVERAVNDGIWDWNLQTNEGYLSPQWKRLLGYGDDELATVVMPFVDLLHPDDREPVRAAISPTSRPVRPMSPKCGFVGRTEPIAGFSRAARRFGMPKGGRSAWSAPSPTSTSAKNPRRRSPKPRRGFRA